MAPTMKSLGLENAPVEHRLELAEELWDSIVADPESLPMPPSHWAELQRRLALPDDATGESWEEVRREMESEL